MLCHTVEAWRRPGWLCTADRKEEYGLSSVGGGEVNSSVLVSENGNLGNLIVHWGLGEINYKGLTIGTELFI